jgi:hypothetical protein
MICLAGLAVRGAQADSVSEEELKAALVFKFAQFTDWPKLPAEFRVCLLGAENPGGALQGLRGKTLKEVPVVVNRLSSEEDAKNCQIVVMNAPSPARLAQWLAGLRHLPVLTVSDEPEAWDQGAMIVFSVESNRIRFDINASAAHDAGLNFRAQMLQLAREVR